MKTVVSISLGSARHDFDFTTRFLGTRLRVRRLGTNGSLARVRKLVQEWDGEAAAIGVGLVKDSDGLGVRADGQAERLAATAERTPVTTGARLADLLQEWAVRHAQAELGHYFDNARVLFFSGVANRKLVQTMSEYTENLGFADPVLQLGVPKLLGSVDALQLYASGAHLVAEWVPPRLTPAPLLAQWSRHVLRHALRKCTVVVAPVHELDGFGAAELAGKTVVTSTVSEQRLEALRRKGVQMVIDGAPVIGGHVIAPDLLHAMIVAVRRQPPQQIAEDDLLEILAGLQLAPRIVYPNGFKRVNRFAFVIHPLSQEYFKVVKPVEILSQVSPPLFMDTLEKVLAYAPPFVYSTVTGIKSPTGVEAEGWLISVGGTPHEIMSHPPEFTYKRLLAAAEMAKKLGAQIMGLGAFTKIVGDAGVTVARRAPLPITTGNSYSASAALWAAHDALLRLALLPPPKGSERVKFKAMVVGATGAIGAACSRLLARAAEEIYLVSPETAKLLALKESILKESPGVVVHLAARTDRHVGEMDMIVTATSGAGKKVLDIMKVKPGCVITDVARPLDLPPEEVLKRPDVLVIESGEIQLPGEPKMKNIGLPPGVTYACLAETIVLALEGRFENFTVGRQIEWEKVREIYQLGLKHGMKLAAISGVHGVITDEQIARVRELALAARAKQAAAGGKPAAAKRVAAKRAPAKRAKSKGVSNERAAAPAPRQPAK